MHCAFLADGCGQRHAVCHCPQGIELGLARGLGSPAPRLLFFVGELVLAPHSSCTSGVRCNTHQKYGRRSQYYAVWIAWRVCALMVPGGGQFARRACWRYGFFEIIVCDKIAYNANN